MLNGSGEQGVRVNSVVQGLPAAEKLRPGDIITHVNNVALRDTDGLMLQVGRQAAGSLVSLKVKRFARNLTVPVVLAKYNVRGEKIVTQLSPAWRGIRVDYASAHWSPDQFVEPPVACVYVTDVVAESPAWKAGVRAGNLIGKIGSKNVTTPAEFYAATRGLRGSVAIRLDDKDIERPLRSIATP